MVYLLLVEHKLNELNLNISFTVVSPTSRSMPKHLIAAKNVTMYDWMYELTKKRLLLLQVKM